MDNPQALLLLQQFQQRVMMEAPGAGAPTIIEIFFSYTLSIDVEGNVLSNTVSEENARGAAASILERNWMEPAPEAALNEIRQNLNMHPNIVQAMNHYIQNPRITIEQTEFVRQLASSFQIRLVRECELLHIPITLEIIYSKLILNLDQGIIDANQYLIRQVAVLLYNLNWNAGTRHGHLNFLGRFFNTAPALAYQMMNYIMMPPDALAAAALPEMGAVHAMNPAPNAIGHGFPEEVVNAIYPVRDIPRMRDGEPIESEVSMAEIEQNDLMVDFGNPAESTFGRYYTADILPNLNNQNPHTRQPITNIVYYRANLVPPLPNPVPNLVPGGRRKRVRRSIRKNGKKRSL
jgi:hypothetical protein